MTMQDLHALPRARNSEGSATFTVLTTVAHDHAWWAEAASRTGSDWHNVVEAAIEMMVAAGIGEQPESKGLWAQSWREAAVEYHRDQAGRLAVEIEPKRLARPRRLMEDGVSPDRAWHELHADRPTPEVTLDAIKLAVRERGLVALNEPATQQRLRHCDADARTQLDGWLASFRARNCP
jgi:hypothetical protein